MTKRIRVASSRSLPGALHFNCRRAISVPISRSLLGEMPCVRSQDHGEFETFIQKQNAERGKLIEHSRRKKFMLKTETEQILRRCMEETKAEFTEEQIQFLAIALNKICGRIVEEALSSFKAGGGGRGGGGFYAG